MTAETLLADIEREGGQLRLNERGRIAGKPPELMTPERIAQIKEVEPELFRLLLERQRTNGQQGHALHRTNHSDHVTNSAVDDLIDDIYSNDNSRERFELIEQLPMACRGVIARHFLAVEQIRLVGKPGGNGLKIWGAREQWLQDFIRRNIGPIVQTDTYFTCDARTEFADADAPPPPRTFADPDPAGGQRPMVTSRTSQADLIEWLTAPETGATLYWGSRRVAVRNQLLAELQAELDEGGIGAGVNGFDSAWIRRRDGRLIVVRRLDD